MGPGFESLRAYFLGEMAEWSIAPVLKTDVLRGTGGSNPSLSAKVADYQRLVFFTAIFDCVIKLYNGSAIFVDMLYQYLYLPN